jgi:peptidoglycan-associated lipoprotein
MNRLLLSVLMLGMLGACATSSEQGAGAGDGKAGTEAVDRPAIKPAESQPLKDKSTAGNALTDPDNILSRRSVYYEFDSDLVKDEYKPLVIAHARYLREHGTAAMRIEGNTDERGSREYNLALGQRRADAVKQMMQLMGASVTKIETISYGEEKPRGTGSDDASWAENRRSDIVYQSE